MQRGPGSLGDPARGIPTLLEMRKAEDYHEPAPLPPFELGPPFRPGPLPPFCTSLGRVKGQGVPAREGGSWLLDLWAVWPWEHHEPGAPNEPGPLASPDLGWEPDGHLQLHANGVGTNGVIQNFLLNLRPCPPASKGVFGPPGPEIGKEFN